MRIINQTTAREWLDIEINQRSLNKHAIERYARDMEAGRWHSDVAPAILLDQESGGVIDGRHRLVALLRLPEGATLQSEVKTVKPSSIQVVDTGRPRSLADTLSIRGYPSRTGIAMSALLNTSAMWAAGVRANVIMSRSEQVDWVDNNPNAVPAAEAAIRATDSARLFHIPTGVVASLWDIAEFGFGSDTVDDFVATFQSGDHQIAVLRRAEALITQIKNPRSRMGMRADLFSYLIVRVYVAWATDETPQRLYARRNVLNTLPGFDEWSMKRFGL